MRPDSQQTLCGLMLWTDEDLYLFNRKRVSGKGITKGLRREREGRQEREEIIHNTLVQ